jgi:hypothetical protein
MFNVPLVIVIEALSVYLPVGILVAMFYTYR